MGRRKIHKKRVGDVDLPVNSFAARVLQQVARKRGSYTWLHLRAGLAFKLTPPDHPSVRDCGFGWNCIRKGYEYGDAYCDRVLDAPILTFDAVRGCGENGGSDEAPEIRQPSLHSIQMRRIDGLPPTAQQIVDAVKLLKVRLCYCEECCESLAARVEEGDDAVVPSYDVPRHGTHVTAEQMTLRMNVAKVNGIPLWINDVDERIDAALNGEDQPPLPAFVTKALALKVWKVNGENGPCPVDREPVPEPVEDERMADNGWQLPVGFQDAASEEQL